LRRRTLRSSVLLLACAALAACHVGQMPRPDVINPDSAARADIGIAREAFLAAVREGDPERIAAFFTDDAMIVEGDSVERAGDDAVRAAGQAAARAGIRVAEADMEPEVVHVAGGGNAFEFGRFRETVRQGGAGVPGEVAPGTEWSGRGGYTIHWQRGAEAQWRIRRLFRTSPPGRGPGAPG
jgi:ketosteroid isomerase-like protein